MRLLISIAVVQLLTAVSAATAEPSANGASRAVSAIKSDIVRLARTFEGQGDPNFTRQRKLDALVKELLVAAPQPPVKQRLDLLTGAWRQIWGPYEYRNDSRGVDPKSTPAEIYQVVFADGYYWNVTPLKGENTIALLRGEYSVVDAEGDFIKARFTRYPGNEGRPAGMQLWELAKRAEARNLPNPTTVVSEFIVYWFFGGGYLREVYTDQTLRITYGGSKLNDRSDEFIYVMERVGNES